MQHPISINKFFCLTHALLQAWNYFYYVYFFKVPVVICRIFIASRAPIHNPHRQYQNNKPCWVVFNIVLTVMLTVTLIEYFMHNRTSILTKTRCLESKEKARNVQRNFEVINKVKYRQNKHNKIWNRLDKKSYLYFSLFSQCKISNSGVVKHKKIRLFINTS